MVRQQELSQIFYQEKSKNSLSLLFLNQIQDLQLESLLLSRFISNQLLSSSHEEMHQEQAGFHFYILINQARPL